MKRIVQRIAFGTVAAGLILAASVFCPTAQAHGPYGRYGTYGMGARPAFGYGMGYTSGYAPFTGGYMGTMVPPYTVYSNRYMVPYGAGYSGGWQPYQGFYRQGPRPQVGFYFGF